MADDEVADDVTRNVLLQPRPSVQNVAHVKPISRMPTLATMLAEPPGRQISNRTIQSEVAQQSKQTEMRDTAGTTVVKKRVEVSSDKRKVVSLAQSKTSVSYRPNQYYLIKPSTGGDAKLLYQCVTAIVNGTEKKILVPAVSPPGGTVAVSVQRNMIKSLLPVRRLVEDGNGKLKSKTGFSTTVTPKPPFDENKPEPTEVSDGKTVASEIKPRNVNNESMKIDNVHPVSGIIANEVYYKNVGTSLESVNEYIPPVKRVRARDIVSDSSLAASSREIICETPATKPEMVENLPLKIESVCTLAAPGVDTASDDPEMPVLTPMLPLTTENAVKIKEEPSMEGYEGNSYNIKDTSDHEEDSAGESCPPPKIKIKTEPRDLDSPCELEGKGSAKDVNLETMPDFAAQIQADINTVTACYGTDEKKDELVYKGFGDVTIKDEPLDMGFWDSSLPVGIEEERCQAPNPLNNRSTRKCKVVLRKCPEIAANTGSAVDRKRIAEVETAELEHVDTIKLENDVVTDKLKKHTESKFVVSKDMFSKRRLLAHATADGFMGNKQVTAAPPSVQPEAMSEESGPAVQQRLDNYTNAKQHSGNARSTIQPIKSLTVRKSVDETGHKVKIRRVKKDSQESNPKCVADALSLARTVNSNPSMFQSQSSQKSVDTKKSTPASTPGNVVPKASPSPLYNTSILSYYRNPSTTVNNPHLQNLAGSFRVASVNGTFYLVPDRPSASVTTNAASSSPRPPSHFVSNSTRSMIMPGSVASPAVVREPLCGGNVNSVVPVSSTFVGNLNPTGNIKALATVVSSSMKGNVGSAPPASMTLTITSGGGVTMAPTCNLTTGLDKNVTIKKSEHSRINTATTAVTYTPVAPKQSAIIALPVTGDSGQKLVVLPPGFKIFSPNPGTVLPVTINGQIPSANSSDRKPAIVSQLGAHKGVISQSGGKLPVTESKSDNKPKNSGEDLHAERIRKLKLRLQESAAAVDELRRQKQLSSSKTDSNIV